MAGGANEPRDKGRRKLPPREVLKLILATYAASLPYVVGFMVIMLLVVWALTTFVLH